MIAFQSYFHRAVLPKAFTPKETLSQGQPPEMYFSLILHSCSQSIGQDRGRDGAKH